VADVENVHLLALFVDLIDNTINMRLVAVKEMPQLGILRCHGTAIRIFLQAEHGALKASIPFQSAVGA